MPKEESKNVVNAIYGMFKVMTGQVMRTLDNQIQKKVTKLGMIVKSQLYHILKIVQIDA